MNADTHLVAHLRGQPGVMAMVAGRIYPDRMPDDATLPCIVYRCISTIRSLSSGKVALSRYRYQIDCWGQRHTDAAALAGELRDALDFAEPAGLHASFPDNEADDPDPDSGAYRRRLDYFIWER